MKQRIFAVVLLILAVCSCLMVPLLASTATGTLAYSKTQKTSVATSMTMKSALSPTKPPTPAPFLTLVGIPPVINAKAAYLLDADTDHTLTDQHGEVPLPMTSTTKIMTALVALQMASPDTLITVQQDAVNETALHNGSSAHLIAGNQLTLKDLLYALLLPSGDDAAVAIAEGLSGTTEQFVAVMNHFASRLRLFQTHYINPDGLTYYQDSGQPVPGQYTTAYDLVRLTKYVQHILLFSQIVKTASYTVPADATHQTYTWQNTNALLGGNPDYPDSAYAGTTGVKTGFTDEAGYCLVFSATQAGHHLIGAVLFSTDTDTTQRFRDAKTLLNWGFGLPVLPPVT